MPACLEEPCLHITNTCKVVGSQLRAFSLRIWGLGFQLDLPFFCFEVVRTAVVACQSVYIPATGSDSVAFSDNVRQLCACYDHKRSMMSNTLSHYHIAARPQSTPLGQASSPKCLFVRALAWQCLGRLRLRFRHTVHWAVVNNMHMTRFEIRVLRR